MLVNDAALAHERSAGAAPLDVTARLLRVAMTTLRMVEDGHPDDPEWFRIMCEQLRTIADLTDAAVMDGEEAVIEAHERSAGAAPLDVDPNVTDSVTSTLESERGA